MIDVQVDAKRHAEEPMNDPTPEAARGVAPRPGEAGPPSLPSILADGLKYWEPRRLIYNVVLLAIVVGHVVAGWSATRSVFVSEKLLQLFILAILANVAYCAAYVADVFIQLSSVRGPWLRRRWALLLIGTLFAAALTHLVSLGLISGGR